MPNHIHLVGIPETAASLGETLRDAHTAYAVYRNRCEQCTGHVWQGRFFSCVLDEAHLWAAMRYVERNPVRAGLVATASDYRWSSAATHCGLRDDPLLTRLPSATAAVPDWAAWLAVDDLATLDSLRRSTHTGRPVGSPEFLAHLEARLGRPVLPGKRGPKPKSKEHEQERKG
jgi:putative transposase